MAEQQTAGQKAIRGSELVTAPGTLTYPIVSGIVFATTQGIQIIFGWTGDPRILSAIVAVVFGALLIVLDIATEESISLRVIIVRTILGIFNIALLVAGALGIEAVAENQGVTVSSTSS